jgi:hypothetical protein
VLCYSQADANLAQKILRTIDSPWQVTIEKLMGTYPTVSKYSDAVMRFVVQALADAEWRGNVLEFDRV